LARPIRWYRPVLDIREQNGGILDFIKYYWWGYRLRNPRGSFKAAMRTSGGSSEMMGTDPHRDASAGWSSQTDAANQHNGRKLADRFLQNGFQAAGNVIWDHILSLCIFAIELQICIFLSILHRTFAINLFEEPYKYRFS